MMQSIEEAHTYLRALCDKVDMDKIPVQSKTFYSMQVSIKSDLYKNAMMVICKRFSFSRPLALSILKEHSSSVERALAGIEAPPCIIRETPWTKRIQNKILLAKGVECASTDTMVQVVSDMVQHDVHVDAMFEMCQKYGIPSQVIVDCVLDWYINSCSQKVVECRA